MENSSIDAQRLFLQLIDPADAQAIAPQLNERIKRRIVNSNVSIKQKPGVQTPG
ncbi:hypothetical protein MC7420_1560 [Coleofasciculus chthonoplastes PCC 7420]|uniref:Uncharacterized protein n=1 Tax=Coleofasciculus chthonoplastes PCC 7420 TaxID=118168 RepID=B4W330_9CYAN|nr:hypothetical protein [Coleofasciculus chthonoplastes]EDX71346.1 hypothetical protein MC7420_1560 [Coleofasciculus chthonoplastes PCC 7420]